MKKKLKVLWAVDAFNDVPELNTKASQVLNVLAIQADLTVDPVYVLSPSQLGIGLEFTDSWCNLYVPSAKKALQMQLKELKVPGLGEPHVLTHPQSSLKGTIDTLTKYAADQSYDLILTGSHGRDGMKRMMLGSFAEQLLLQAKIPVLIVGSQGSVSGSQTQRILIPNDFSEPESDFFDAALGFASTMGAKTTLFNVIQRPIEQVYHSGAYLLSGAWVPMPTFLESERGRKNNDAEIVLKKARSMGLASDLAVDDTSVSVVEAILEAAKRTEASFIAIEAQSGAVASALLGSITRQVVRHAPCPVWVYRRSENQSERSV